MALHLRLFPICGASPIIKPHANVIMNLNINIHRSSHGVRARGSYAYFFKVGRILHYKGA
jgi:hypothetical protein